MTNKTIEQMLKVALEVEFYGAMYEGLDDQVDHFRRGFLKGAEAARPKWIKCSEKLPEASGGYLVKHYNGWMSVRMFNAQKEMFIYDEVYDGTITAWMPLPKYEGGE